MMEEHKEHGNACGGDGCGHCRQGMHGGMWGGEGMHRFVVLRIALLLAIVSFVFWGGVKLGELKSSFYGGGYRHERYYGYGSYPPQSGVYSNNPIAP